MTRLLLLVAAAITLLAAAWSTGRSSAAFVDAAETTATVQADSVDQWIVVPNVPEDGPCRDADQDVECSVEVEARSPLPGGAASIDVRLTTAAAGAAGRSDRAPSTEAALAAGERRTLSVTLPEREDLRVSARTAGDSTDFLSQMIPACGSKPCGGDNGGVGGDDDTTPPTQPVEPGQTPAQPGEPPVRGESPPTTTSTATAERSQGGPDAPAPQILPAPGIATRPACMSRRRFTVRLPHTHRGRRVVAARVTVGKRRVATKRRNGRLTVAIDLRGVARSQVRVVALLRLAGGRTARHVRVYRTCYRRAATDTGS